MGGMFLELFYLIKEEPYDYAVLAGESGEKPDESRIRSLVEECGISLSEWHSLDLLLLGREHQYMDAAKNGIDFRGKRIEPDCKDKFFCCRQ